MEILPANLEFLFQQFDQRYQAAYESQPTNYQLYADEMPSVSERNVYGWLAETTGLREWIGARVVDSMVAREYTLGNKDWEKTIGLSRNRIKDDTYGVFSKSVDMLGIQGKLWPEDVMTAVVQAGVTAVCFDGQFFFDTDHPVDLDNPGAGTYSNKLVGAAYNLSVAGASAYDAAVTAMMGVKGEGGRELGIIPNVLMVPPVLRKAALELIKAPLITQVVKNVAGAEIVAAAAATNVFQGEIGTVLVNPRLANEPTVWYLLNTTRGIKPFIWQLRQPPSLVARIAPTDPAVFDTKMFLYGVDARGAGGYSLPFLAFRMSPA